jgi:hypothetical protein
VEARSRKVISTIRLQGSRITSRSAAATSWQWIPQPLLASGVYQGILQSASIVFTAPCLTEIHGVNLVRELG